MAEEHYSITLHLPPEMAEKVEKRRHEQGWTLDQLVRVALEQYLQDREWEDVLTYGEQRSAEKGLKPEDVERLIDEYRSEAS